VLSPFVQKDAQKPPSKIRAVSTALCGANHVNIAGFEQGLTTGSQEATFY